jgi:hypothetical protein
VRAAIALMMDAASTSETSVNFYQTTRPNNPEIAIFILAADRTSNVTLKRSRIPFSRTNILLYDRKVQQRLGKASVCLYAGENYFTELKNVLGNQID